MTSSFGTKIFCVVLVTCLSTPAAAQIKFDTASGGSVTLYGQFSPSYLSFDDGVSRTVDVVDNTNSNSRIGLWYRKPFRWGQLNVNIETALGFRASNTQSQLFQPVTYDWNEGDIRKVEVIWETRRVGTFYLGQGSMASDGVANLDLSGTSIVSYVGIPDTAGSYFLRTEAGGLSPVIIGAAFPNFDGGRRGRFRYDSPSFSGFVLSASIGQQILANTIDTKDTDMTLRYDRDGPRFRIVAAGGYTWINRKTGANNRTAIGSFSIEHKATGISLTSSTGSRDTAGYYSYIKLGYQAGMSRFGPFSVSVDYYVANDMVSDGSKSESYGFGILQKFDNPRIEAYLGLRSYQFADISPIRYQDAYSVLAGARWKF